MSALGPVGSLLAEALALVAARLPEADARLRRALDGETVALALDDERVAVAFGPATIEVLALDPAAPAMITAGAAAIVAVVDAELTLAEAVERDQVRVRGALATLERLHAGLLIFLHAAVRCPGFPLLLTRLRRHADRVSAHLPTAAPPSA